MNLFKRFVLLLLVLLCCACASNPVPPPDYNYAEGAIRIHLKADPQLNLYDGRPHTLVICVYQLDSPNGFNNMTGTMEGLYKLLECQRFDSSVTHSERLIVHPGKDGTYTLNRAEGSEYVAIVAGYFDIQKDHITRLFPVPVITKSKSFFSREKIQQPQNIYIDLKLAPGRIKEAKASVFKDSE